MRPLKVLLVSPMPDLDPPGGDVTHSLALLDNPPEGVEYEPYSRALSRGALRERGRRASLQRAWYEKKNFLREFALVAANNTVERFRKANLLFWEPFRFFSLPTHGYDLIHVHVFSVRFDRLNCPVVASYGGELAHLYRHARNFPEGMIRRRELANRVLGRWMGVNVNSGELPQVTRLMTYTEGAARSFARRGVFPTEKISVVPTFLPSAPARPSHEHPRRVGFIARNFEHKGGPTLLAAWEQVRAARPSAELLIGGCEPQLTPTQSRERGIVWQPYIARDQLLASVLPTLDVFAYPTNYDYLPCYTLLEVMSRGIPVAASDHGNMPEVLDEGRAGLLSPTGDGQKLARNILRLLNPAENRAFGQAAWSQFERRYSARAVRPMIRACYDAALRDCGISAQD